MTPDKPSAEHFDKLADMYEARAADKRARGHFQKAISLDKEAAAFRVKAEELRS